MPGRVWTQEEKDALSKKMKERQALKLAGKLPAKTAKTAKPKAPKVKVAKAEKTPKVVKVVKAAKAEPKAKKLPVSMMKAKRPYNRRTPPAIAEASIVPGDEKFENQMKLSLLMNHVSTLSSLKTTSHSIQEAIDTEISRSIEIMSECRQSLFGKTQFEKDEEIETKQVAASTKQVVAEVVAAPIPAPAAPVAKPFTPGNVGEFRPNPIPNGIAPHSA